MIYAGMSRGSLVTEEFNSKCTEYRIEARIQVYPNPGSPTQAMRLITFTNFNNEALMILQQDRRKRKHILPARGTLEVLIAADEPLPEIQRELNYDA